MTWALIHFGNISESLSNQNKASTNYSVEQSWAAAKCLKAPFHGMFLKKMSGLSLIKINYMYLIISMVLSGHLLCNSMFWRWAWQSWSPPEAPESEKLNEVQFQILKQMWNRIDFDLVNHLQNTQTEPKSQWSSNLPSDEFVTSQTYTSQNCPNCLGIKFNVSVKMRISYVW